MNELCCNHDGDNPHDIIAEEIGSGQLRDFEHITKRYQQLDRTYHNRAASRGVVGAAYWKPGKGRRRRGAPISAVSRREDDDDIAEISDGFSRVVRLGQKMNDMETSPNKFQTHSTSAAVAQKADSDRRISILGGKADVTHNVCVKTLESLTQLSQQISKQALQPPANQTAAYPQDPNQVC